MAVFTRVSEADLTAWLSDYSLGTLLELQGIPSASKIPITSSPPAMGASCLTLFEKLTADELAFLSEL